MTTTAGNAPLPGEGDKDPMQATGADVLERGPRRVLLEAVALGVIAGDVLAGGPQGLPPALGRARHIGRNTLSWSLEKPLLRDVARPALDEMAELGRMIADGIESTPALAALGGMDGPTRAAAVHLWRSISGFCLEAGTQALAVGRVADTLTRHLTLVSALHDSSPGLLLDPRFRVFYVLRGHELEEAGRGRLYSLLVGRLVAAWRPRGRVRRELSEQARERGVSLTDMKREVIRGTLAGLGGRLWRTEADLLLSGSRRAEGELERDSRHRSRSGVADPLHEERELQAESDEDRAPLLETLSRRSEAQEVVAELMELGSPAQRRIIEAMEAAVIDLVDLADTATPEQSDASLIRKRAAEDLGIAPVTLRVQLARLREKARDARRDS